MYSTHVKRTILQSKGRVLNSVPTDFDYLIERFPVQYLIGN